MAGENPTKGIFESILEFLTGAITSLFGGNGEEGFFSKIFKSLGFGTAEVATTPPPAASASPLRSVFNNVSNALRGGFESVRNALFKSGTKVRLTSDFGQRAQPTPGASTNHHGFDIAAKHGTDVLAPADGTVRFVGKQRGYGNTVILDHGNGITTLMGHFSRFAAGLKPGQIVQKGETIAYVGSTGVSTGNHVHYEVRQNGKPVNPGFNLAAALERTNSQTYIANRTNGALETEYVIS